MSNQTEPVVFVLRLTARQRALLADALTQFVENSTEASELEAEYRSQDDLEGDGPITLALQVAEGVLETVNASVAGSHGC